MSKMTVDLTEQAWMAAPKVRRSSVELLDEVAEFEESVGFPLLERHWVAKSETASERSVSPVDLGILATDGHESQHPVLRTWSPTTETKTVTKIPSNTQAPLTN